MFPLVLLGAALFIAATLGKRTGEPSAPPEPYGPPLVPPGTIPQQISQDAPYEPRLSEVAPPEWAAHFQNMMVSPLAYTYGEIKNFVVMLTARGFAFEADQLAGLAMQLHQQMCLAASQRPGMAPQAAAWCSIDPGRFTGGVVPPVAPNFTVGEPAPSLPAPPTPGSTSAPAGSELEDRVFSGTATQAELDAYAERQGFAASSAPRMGVSTGVAPSSAAVAAAEAAKAAAAEAAGRAEAARAEQARVAELKSAASRRQGELAAAAGKSAAKGAEAARREQARVAELKSIASRRAGELAAAAAKGAGRANAKPTGILISLDPTIDRNPSVRR